MCSAEEQRLCERCKNCECRKAPGAPPGPPGPPGSGKKLKKQIFPVEVQAELEAKLQSRQ